LHGFTFLCRFVNVGAHSMRWVPVAVVAVGHH
jgi:hypothetical protein